MDKFKSFAITIRPRHGVDNKIESKFMKWIQKQDYGICVAEKEHEERHLHIQTFHDKPKAKGDVAKQMARLQQQSDQYYDEVSERVCKKGVKVAYNDDFHKNYLLNNPEKSEDKTEILYKKLPKDTSLYYPSEEYQDEAYIIKHATDQRFAKHAIEYAKWLKTKPYEHSKYAVAGYLSYRMYGVRDMKVLTSQKAKQELAFSLYLYIKGECEESTMSFINTDLYVTKEEHSFIVGWNMGEHKATEKLLKDTHNTN